MGLKIGLYVFLSMSAKGKWSLKIRVSRFGFQCNGQFVSHVRAL